MKFTFLLLLLFTGQLIQAQELFVYTEPASNMPAHSFSAKLTDHLVTRDNIYNRVSQRFMPQAMFGFSRKWMLHAGLTFSNMHTASFRYESWNLYLKYRFLSHDDIHRHFRMAVYAEGSSTRAPFHYDEISLMGDKSGISLGLVATQLLNRLALSANIWHTQVLDKSRNNDIIYVPERLYQSIDYAISAGYLVFPKNYTGYKQTNLNLYMEWLGEESLDARKYCLDAAPALQLIFNSNTKLNVGGRFQVAGNMSRMSKQSWLVSVETTFLNALPRKR
jgi:hypothetical protein